MPQLSADMNVLVQQVCAGLGGAFVVLLLAVVLSEKIFGVVENDEDWNG